MLSIGICRPIEPYAILVVYYHEQGIELYQAYIYQNNPIINAAYESFGKV